MKKLLEITTAIKKHKSLRPLEDAIVEHELTVEGFVSGAMLITRARLKILTHLFDIMKGRDRRFLEILKRYQSTEKHYGPSVKQTRTYDEVTKLINDIEGTVVLDEEGEKPTLTWREVKEKYLALISNPISNRQLDEDIARAGRRHPERYPYATVEDMRRIVEEEENK